MAHGNPCHIAIKQYGYFPRVRVSKTMDKALAKLGEAKTRKEKRLARWNLKQTQNAWDPMNQWDTINKARRDFLGLWTGGVVEA